MAPKRRAAPPRPSANGGRRTAADYALLLATAYFALKLDGPSSVLNIAAFVAQFFTSRRVAFLPAYVAAGVAVQSFRVDGFGAYAEETRVLLRVLLVLAVLLTLAADRFLCPYGGRVPRPLVSSPGHPSGSASGWEAAMIEVVGASGSLVRLYYPTRADRSSAHLHPYFLHGARETVSGVASFLNLPSFFLAWIGKTRPWCYEADPDATPPAETGERYRVAVVSHGLGGTPDLYSFLIADLVARGYLVAAVHHADGSAAYVRMDDGYPLYYEHLSGDERAASDKEYKRRHGQLNQRSRELTAAVDIVLDLAKKSLDDVYDDFERDKKAAAAAAAAAPKKQPAEPESPEPEDMQLARLLLHGRIAKDVVVAYGHSFGAATAITAAQADDRITCCVALDPWIFPLSPMVLSRGLPSTPVLVVEGQGWRDWKANHVGVAMLMDQAVRDAHVRAEATNAQGRPHELVVSGGCGISRTGEVSPKFFVQGSASGPGGPPSSVHPGSACIALRGVEHSNFNDFAVTAERIMMWTGQIGKTRPALESLRLVAAATSQYLDHVVRQQMLGRKGLVAWPAFSPSPAVTKEIYVPSDHTSTAAGRK